MESNHQEEFMYSSDQEVEQPEQENSFGVGRSYECVFCRRGFNTAQALGGHMNIHRKDRARNKPSTINTSKHEGNYTGPRFYQKISSCSPHLVAPLEAVQIEYRTYFPASTSTSPPLYAIYQGIHDDNQQRFNVFEDDRRMNLSLPFGSGLVEEIAKNTRRGGIQEEELDLELRL